MPTRNATSTTRNPASKKSPRRAARKPASTQRVAQRRRPRLSRLLAWLLAAVLGGLPAAYAQVAPNALPTGGRVVVGAGQLQQGSSTLVITQSTPKLGMDWQSFNIGSNAMVEFVQPGADSVALNRVIGNSGSEIYGRLRSNGQVFLTNPNGVLFAPGSKVDVGGLVASTLDLSQQDFAEGRYNFSATGTRGSVVNQGQLRASAGGYIALFGNQVENQGEISVSAGSVLLASGRAATVSIAGGGLISAVVTPGEAGLVSNSGSILADGSTVTLTARSAEGLASSLVNNSGIIRANTLVERAGEVWITGDNVSTTGAISVDASGSGNAGRITVKGDMATGSVHVGGTLSAQAESGDGGQVETSARQVSIASDARVNTSNAVGGAGNWTIDPLDFTVSPGAGSASSTGIGADTLSTNLATTNVTLQTAVGAGTQPGDLTVATNANVSWSSTRTLTLTAARDVNVNANITASGTGAGLIVNPGTGGAFNLSSTAKITLSGPRAGLQIAGNTYTLVSSIAELQAINASTTTRAGNWALAVDIDASASASLNNGQGFLPIGTAPSFSSNNSFRGRFDGLGHEITGLVVNLPSSDYVGLFGTVHDASIRNVQLTGGSFNGATNVGSIAAYVANSSANTTSSLVNLRSSASVSTTSNGGTSNVGGLVGQFITQGLIDRSSSSSNVTDNTSFGNVGGLVGYQSAGSISNSSASGTVSATVSAVDSRSVGGLVGYFGGTGSISVSSATGNVSGGYNIGGLVGYHNSTGPISAVSASGNVSGTQYVGGLIGQWNQAGTMDDAHAQGNVSGRNNVGGLVGYGYYDTSITNSSASGQVTATSTANIGGLVGYLEHTSVSSSSATGSVTGDASANVNVNMNAGGLIGYYYNTAVGGLLSGTASGNVSISSTSGNVGGLVGQVPQGDIAQSTSSGSVTATSPSNLIVGGLIGRFDGTGSLSHVTANGATSGGYITGGLVGYYASTGNVSFATATGNVAGLSTSSQYVGGLFGQMVNAGSISDSQASGAVLSNYDAGGLVGYWYNNGSITDSLATGNVTSTTNNASAGGLIGYGAYGTGMNNVTAHGNVQGAAYAGGLVGQQTYGGNVTRATATGNVSIIGDGSGYVGGLFGYYYNTNVGATISNSSATGSVTLDTSSGYAGGLVGQMYYASLASSTATGNVLARDSLNPNNQNHYAGGLIGYYYATAASTSITDSTASGSVTSTYMAGGLAGFARSSTLFTNVTASGNVTATYSVGGLFGQMSDSAGIAQGTATGNVTGNSGSSYVGGLVGYAYTTAATRGFADVIASGNVIGGSYAGGLVGYYDDYSTGAGNGGLTNARATGNVTGGSFVGGLIGQYNGGSAVNSTGISQSSASGTVRGNNYVGGLVANFSGYGGIHDSVATGDVIGTASSSTHYMGGLAGWFQNNSSTAGQGLLERSMASGNVSLEANAITNSIVSVYGGGLVGYYNGSATAVNIADAYATGSVQLLSSVGQFRAGGLIGFAAASLTRTYATGAVSATGSVSGRLQGGLIAQRNTTGVTAANSFWATDTTGQDSSAAGTASTLSSLKNAATFTGWDMATTGGTSQVWRSYDGLATPLLRGLLTPLTVSLADATKVYDGTSSLASAPITLNGTAVAHPERILVAGTAVNVGTYALSAGNLYSVQNGYDLTVAGSANLSITPRPLTLTGLVANKVYDGTTAATLLALPQLSGLVPGENLAFVPGGDFAAAFATKTAGTGKTVNLTGSYSLADAPGGHASNYSLTSTTTTTANITPAPLTAGTFTATNRAYDGTTSVAVTASSTALSGVVGSDVVSVDLSAVTSGTMVDSHAGTAKAVTVSGLTLTGADAGNYTVAGAAAVTVDIAPKVLTLNGVSATDRQYFPGTTVSLVTTSALLSGVVSGDVVQPALTSLRGTIADKNVANAKPVTLTGMGLRGANIGDYTVQQGSLTVNITPYPLTLFIFNTTGTNRQYDGTAVAVAPFSTTWYSGDNVVPAATSVTFPDKNVAYNSSGTPISRTITASGLTISGTDAGNYALQNTTATTSGVISPRPLTVSGVAAVDRVYDGTRNVTVNISSATIDTASVVPGDQVSVSTPGSGSTTGTTVDKNAGTNKAVTVPGLALTGTDAGNYSITSTGGGVTVNITPKPLTAIYTAVDKVYNGNPYASINVTSADIVTGDSVNFYADQTYCTGCWTFFTTNGFTSNNGYTQSRDAGTNKPVVIVFNGMYGNDAANYTLLNTTGTSTATITPKPVTIAFSGQSKVYDGTTTANVTLNFGGSGMFSGDAVTTTQTAVFTGTNGKNVGTNKPVSVSNIVLSGAQAGNYTVANTTTTTTATVTAKPITVSGITAVDRPYDGTTAVAVTAGTVTSAGFVTGDTVAVALPSGGLSTGTIVDKNVGTNKPVTVTGLTLSGTDAGNYSIDAAGSGITVNITRAALTPTFVGVTKVYDGGVVANVNSNTSGIASGDVVTFTQTAIYTGANARDVGSNKPISVSNIAITGSGAANYSLAATTATTTGGITPKPVTLTFTGGSRVYNGLADVTASVTGNSLQFLTGDSVSVTETAVFTGDGSAGTNKPVSITNITLAGAQAGNYSLSSTSASATATITPRPLGVTGITATNRVYDGTTTVAVNVLGATVDTSTVIAGDQVNVTLPGNGISSGTVDNRNVGVNKPVTITGLTITGTSAANYALIGAAGLFVNITPKQLNATYTASNKIYDGTAAAVVTGSSSDILAIDSGNVGISLQGVFTAGKNVGTGKTVAVTGGFLTGASRDNYALVNPSATTTADITTRTLTVSYFGGSRVYDGGVSAPVTSFLSNSVSGDLVSVAQTAQFTGTSARNVGTNKAIDVSGITLTGADATNYSLATTTASATGTITPKFITVSGLTNVVAQDRVYDGTRIVQVNVPAGVTLVPNSADIVSGDAVTIDVPSSGLTTGTIANKNVGNGKQVSVDGLTLSGTDAGNYAIAGTAGITVNITPKSLTASYTGVNKIYDGSATATASGSSTDLISGDSVLIRGSGQFTGTGGKNVGVGKAVDITSVSLSGSDAGNYTLANTTGSTTADISPRQITASYSGGTRVYDGGTTAPVSSTTTGFISGDAVTLSQSATFTGVNAKNVGTGKAIQIGSIALTGADAPNYSLTATTASATGSITPKPLALLGLTGLTAVDRIYDGTRTVAVNVQSTGSISINPSDIVGSDQVGVVVPTGNTTTGTMANKNAGQGKAVVVNGLGLTGTDAANYMISATDGVTVNIAQRSLTATYTGVNKIYDGTAAATVIGASTDVVSGDNLSINGAGTFTTGKNVGTGKAISVTSGQLTGTDALNYSLANASGTTSADITPKSVTATYLGGTRVYDGTDAAPVTGTVAGLITGDAVTLGQTAVFTGAGAKNVGTGKAVSITNIALSGVDAPNYSLNGNATNTTASITPRPLGLLGLTGVTAIDRVYDGTRTVAVSVSTSGTVTPDPNDLIPGDVVTVTAPPTGTTTGTMADKNVGNNKPVAVAGLSLGGADAGNYSVASTSGVTVNIAPRQLTATYAGVSRVYDGTTAATVNAGSTGIVSGDSLAITANAVFTGVGAKNVGTGKSVTVTGGALTGTDAPNYTLLNDSGTTTADITPRGLSTTYTGGSRVYDGTTVAPVNRVVTGLVTGDSVIFYETATFTGGVSAKNVGTGKPIDISNIYISGDDAANYALSSYTAVASGTITPRPLTVTGLSGITAQTRAYDGTLGVQITVPGNLGTVSGDVLSGDTVTVNLPSSGLGSAVLLDKNVGTNKAVVLTGLSLTGADAPNYVIAGTAGLTVNITPRTLYPVFTGVNRVYDGTANATVLGGAAEIISGDAVSIAGTGLFRGPNAKNVGIGKAIDVTGVSLAGTDAANYAITATTGTASADITPATLTASYAGGTRVYDGTVNAPVTRTLTGLITGDAVTVAESAVFTGIGARNVGSGKAVNISGISISGADAANYNLVVGGTSVTAAITPKPLNIAGLSGITATDRVYDGTTSVAVNIPGGLGNASADIIPGDDVTVNVPTSGLGGANMLDKNVGQNKPVVLTGLSLTGTDATNYTIAGTAGLTVNIAPRTITLTGATAIDRVYDGTTAVALNTSAASFTGALSGDNVSVQSAGLSGQVADKSVGQNKAVSLSQLTLAGSDAGNYVVTSGTGLTVNISRRTLTPTAVFLDKIYDGNTGATITLSDNRVSADANTLTLSAGSAAFASRDAASGIAVSVTGITLGGADAGNYTLAASSLSGTANINRAPLVLTANSFTKLFGNTVALTGSEFTATGLATGESVGGVVLSSAGAASGAAASSTPYAVTIGGATGGSFDPRNYDLSYRGGLITVQPRPLTVAANSLVTYFGEPLPNGFGFSTNVGGLVGGDAITAPSITHPSGTPAVGSYALVPSGSVFSVGSASNYELSYAPGQLIVLPAQPRLGEGSGEGGTSLAVTATPGEIDAADAALRRALQALSGRTGSGGNTSLRSLAQTIVADLTPAEVAELLAGDGSRVSLPDLLKRPLISFDPQLRRLLQGSDSATTP